MPKKSKVNKLARMSDEERARYLQHRADLEEEARRRKRELIARFIKNKLDKEEEYSRMNTAKLNQGWRFVLRRIKCKQMALDIQGMSSMFNFLMERKDRLLKFLQNAIEDSDEQHRRAFQAHTETLGYFLNIGTQRLDKLQNEYESQKNLLLDNWDREELDIMDNQERAHFKLSLITYIQDRDFNSYMKAKEMARATAKNDARLEHEEAMRDVSRPKQLEVELYWTQLREVYASYLEQHKPIMDHYHALREKDDFYRRDIARNEMQIQQEMEQIINLQKESLKTSMTMKCKLERMHNRKEELAKRYWQLKREMKTTANKETDKLTIMVNVSQDAFEHLEKFKGKVVKIMQLHEICKKYELQDDCLQTLEDNEQVDFEDYDEPMLSEYKEYKKLNKFLLKVNRVKVQTLCLRAEKAKLAKENGQLKLYIKKYLTDLALKGNRDRPITVGVRSEKQKIEGVEKIVRPVTCIEGALSNAVLHEKRMKLEERNKIANTIKAYPRVQCWMKTT